MKKLTFATFALVGLFGTGVIQAEDTARRFIETNTAASTSLLWMDAQHWVDASGQPLEAAPINGEDVVFKDLPVLNHKINGMRIQTAKEQDTASRTAISVGSVTGDARHIIRHSAGQKNETNASDHYLTVEDPNGFLGHWEAGGNRAFISLPGTGAAGFVPTLQGLNARKRPMLDVPAGKKAVIANLDGRGAVDVVGAGELEIAASAASEGGVIQRSGKLTLKGESAAELDALLAQSAFHLDASDVNSVILSNDTETGYSWVMRWNDVRPEMTEYYVYGAFGEYSKAAHLIPNMNPAFISKTGAPTGLRLVSFGSNIYHYDPVNMGPTNCILRFNKTFGQIREVFYAVETPFGASYNVGILGRDWDPYSMWEPGTRLFGYGTDANDQRAIANGEVCVNGEYKALEDIDATQLKDLFTVSVGLAYSGSVNLLGTGRGYRTTSCGSRMGELLFFTNVLTRAQRTLVNNYLNAKWRTGSTAQFGTLVTREATAEVSVPDGRTAVVQDVVTAKDGELVKSGAGTLEVGTLASAGDVKLRVTGGSVAFVKTMADPSVAAPAKDPYIWLDANAENCYDDTTSEHFPGATFVTKWYDCRADKRATSFAKCFEVQYNPGAKEVTANVARLPTVTTWKGKRVFDFGTQWDSTLKNRASLQYPNWNGGRTTYAAFAVIRPLNATASHPIFGSYSYTYGAKRNAKILAHEKAASGEIVAARWAVDGVKCDPTVEQPCFSQTEEFFVVSLSSADPFCHDSLLQDRWPGNDTFAYSANAGQFQVAETIAYHRPLSEKEVRDTEAYLMDKWLKKPHPATEPVRIAKLSFASDATPTVEVGADVTVEVAEVDSPDGTVIQTGAGTFKIVAPQDFATLGDITVDGTYTVDCSGGMVSDAVKALHVDPNETAKIVTREVNDPTLGKVTVVDEMGDLDDRQWKCGDNQWRTIRMAVVNSSPSAVAAVATNGVLTTVNLGGGEKKMVTIVGGSDGKARDAVGFLSWAGRYQQINLQPTDLFMIWDDRRDLRKTYGMSDAASAVPFLNRDKAWSYGYWRRAANFAIVHPTDALSASIREGYLSIDGIEVPSSSAVPEGVHLVTAGPTDAVNSACGIGVQPDSSSRYAPYALGELIWYTNKLPLAQHKYVAAKLMKRWFGKNMMTNVVDVGSLTFGNGGTFKVSKNAEADGTAVVCTRLAGDGTVVADRMDGIASLAFAFQSRTEVDRIAVDGVAAFADDVIVTLTVPVEMKPAAGEYVLFSADALENVDLSRWTLNVANPKDRTYSLKRSGSEIRLCVGKPGLTFFVR